MIRGHNGLYHVLSTYVNNDNQVNDAFDNKLEIYSSNSLANNNVKDTLKNVTISLIGRVR